MKPNPPRQPGEQPTSWQPLDPQRQFDLWLLVHSGAHPKLGEAL